MNIETIVKESEEKLVSYNIVELKKSGFLSLNDLFFHSVHYPPRTMYPPIKFKEVARKLSRIDSLDPISLYIHIPFCNTKCEFCFFYTLTQTNPLVYDEYLGLIKKEIGLWKAALKKDVISPASIFIGGGTPTILSPKQLKRLFQIIRSGFDLSSCREFNIEAEPRSLCGKQGLDRIQIMKEYGINRICLGAQTLDNQILKRMGRRHCVEDVEESIQQINSVGFRSLSLDFIYGFPGCSPQSWAKALIQAHKMKFDSYQLYQLCVIPYGPIKGTIASRYRQNHKILPSMYQQRLMKAIGENISRRFGFKEYFRRIYAKSAKHDSYYSNCWCCQLNNVLGLGISAWSSLSDIFLLNTTTDLDGYSRSIRNNQLPTEKGKLRSRNDSLRRHIIMPIKNCSVSIPKYKKLFHADPTEIFAKKIDPLIQHDLIKKVNSSLTLTEKGKFFSDEVAMQFYDERYLPFSRGSYVDGPLNPYK